MVDGGGSGFLVSVDGRGVLHRGSDVVEALQQTSLREGAISNLNIRPCLSAMVWFGRFTVSANSLLLFGALKKFLDLLVGQSGGGEFHS